MPQNTETDSPSSGMTLNCLCPTTIQIMINEQRNADKLDALDTEEEEWQVTYDEISLEEAHACDHYNERYCVTLSD